MLGAALGALAGLQVLVFEEVLATGAVAAAVFAGILALVVRDRARVAESTRRVGRACLPALGAFLAVAGLPLAVQFLGPLRVGGRVSGTAVFSTDLLNLVLPTPYQLVAPEIATDISRQFSGLFHEATAYVGLPLLVILVVVAVRRWSDLRVRVAGLDGRRDVRALARSDAAAREHDTATCRCRGCPISLLPLLEHALPGRLTLYMWLAIADVLAVVVSEVTRARARLCHPPASCPGPRARPDRPGAPGVIHHRGPGVLPVLRSTRHRRMTPSS